MNLDTPNRRERFERRSRFTGKARRATTQALGLAGDLGHLGQDRLDLRVGPRNDVDRDQLTDSASGGGAGVRRGLHRADLAPDHDVVYKPCGAGGGDVGIAVARSAESLASFAAIASQQGFKRLDVQIDPAGARLETQL